jgi:hypothetical protein
MTKQKTLGQIATEAREAYRAAHQGENDPHDPHWLIRADRHVASSIRTEVIEECAKAMAPIAWLVNLHERTSGDDPDSTSIMVALGRLREIRDVYERHSVRQLEEAQADTAIEDAGIQVNMLGGNCPVQAEGAIDGVRFFFRARGEHWSIDVGGDDGFRHREKWGDGPFEAGWMPEDEARRMIEKGAALFRATNLQRQIEEPQGDDPTTEQTPET